MTPLVAMGQDPSGLESHFEQLQPLPMAGRPEHIANAALFLASDDAAFVTGHALVVDGGQQAAGPNLFSRLDVFRGIHGVSRGTTGQEPIIRS